MHQKCTQLQKSARFINAFAHTTDVITVFVGRLLIRYCCDFRFTSDCSMIQKTKSDRGFTSHLLQQHTVKLSYL